MDDSRNSSILIPVVALSLLFGALGGGLAGYYAARNPIQNSAIDSGSTRLSVQEDSATTQVVAESLPAVVSVVASKELSNLDRTVSPFDEWFGLPITPEPETRGKQEVSRGTGFIVQADGLIVTNKHVVDDDEAEYTVILNDERQFTARVVAKDPTNDIAILDIEGENFPTLTLGDSDQVQIGQTVIAIGDPLSFKNSVTKGVISGESRTITASDGQGQAETLEDIFQTDAAINPGNSGGPLLDLAGTVIAMNTAVSQEGQLIGFAIPVNVIKRDIESVKETGKIVRPFLGVRYVLITKEYAEQKKLPVDHGALIQSGSEDDPAVVPDSPAAKAGLKDNDIILEVGGKAVTEDHSLTGLLSAYTPGQTVALKVLRDEKEITLQATLTERQ